MSHATAVTPSLHLGTDLPYPHLVVDTVEAAVAAIDQGRIVVVPTPDLALAVLDALGADPGTAARQVDRAVHGLRAAEPPEPHRPDPGSAATT